MKTLKSMRYREFLRTHQFVAFIVLVILITCLITFIGLSIYVSSGTIKLDLSRPGYEKVRNEVQQSAAQQTFSSSGSLDSAAIKQFNSQLNSSVTDLKNSGNFGGASSLSDQSLGL